MTSIFSNWTVEEYGSIANPEKTMFLHPRLTGWELEISTLQADWLLNDLEEAKKMVSFFEDVIERRKIIEALPEIKKTIQIDDEYLIEASSKSGYFHIYVLDSENKEMGYYEGGLNNGYTEYLLNETTIQGGAFLDEKIRGRGIIDQMRDLAEELTTLKAVPHGLNCTFGSLSDSALKSWEKRASKKYVPGMSNKLETRIKKQKIDKIVDIVKDLHNIAYMETEDVVNLAIELNLDIKCIKTENEILKAWLIDKNETPLCDWRHENGDIFTNPLNYQKYWITSYGSHKFDRNKDFNELGIVCTKISGLEAKQFLNLDESDQNNKSKSLLSNSPFLKIIQDKLVDGVFHGIDHKKEIEWHLKPENSMKI